MESRQVDWSLDHNVLTFQAKLKDINSLMFAFTSYNHDCSVYMTVRVNDESFVTLGDGGTSFIPSIRQLTDVDIVDALPNQVLCINDNGLVENRFITFVAAYNVTENAVIDEEFNKGSIILCYRGYAYAEYLPMIRRISKTGYPDPVTYIYVFGAVHSGHVVEITCDPVDGWSVEETPVGGPDDTYQLKGPWAVGEAYVMNDFCTFGGNLYICKSGYTSDPESDNPSIDTDHWDLFFSGSRRKYQLKEPGANEDISWAPIVNPEEFTVLGNITSSMTSLVITLSAPPDSVYCYEYNFRFTTPSVLGITTFSILDHNSTAVNWLGNTPSLLGGKTYEVSVVDGYAVIGESV